MVGPDGFQSSTVGMPQGITPTFFFPANQPAPASPTYQSQSARQATPPLQQSQGGFPAQVLPIATQFVQPTTFPVFQPPRIYNQQVTLASLNVTGLAQLFEVRGCHKKVACGYANLDFFFFSFDI